MAIVDEKTRSSCKKVFKLIYKLSQGMWLARIVALLAPVVMAIHFTIFPVLVGKFVDYLFIKINHGTNQTILPWLIAYICWWMVFLGIRAAYKKIVYCDALPRMKMRLEEMFFNKLLSQDSHFYDLNPPGSVSGKLFAAANTIRPFLDMVVWGTLRSFCMFFFAVPRLLGVSWLAFLISIFWMASFTWLALVYANKIYQSVSEESEIQRKTGEQICDTLDSIRTVRFFNGQEHEAKRASELFQNESAANLKTEKLYLKIWYIYAISFFIYFSSILAMMLNAALAHKISSTDFMIVLQTFGLVAIFWWGMIFDLTYFSSGIATISSAIEAIEEKQPKIKEIPKAYDLKITKGLIELINVSFSYPETGNKVFENLSLTIQPGQKVGIIGRAVSGKSTLVNLLLREFDLDSGHILIDSQDIKLVTLRSLRQSIALIEQTPRLFGRSIFDNICYGNLSSNSRQVERAAKLANADELINSFKDGYQSIIGQKNSILSADQTQRIAIARAILKDSKIIIFDEATSQQDPIDELEIKKALNGVLSSKTVIFIAHRLSSINQMNRIVILENGMVAQDGTPEDLSKVPGLYQEIMLAQREQGKKP